MATKTTTLLIDDMDGSPATETVSFGLDGAAYEIDLNEANASKLRDALALYVSEARRGDSARRRGPGRGRPAKAGRATPDREQTTAIREWARSQGMAVSDRGRLSATVVEAFEAAH
ncbi:Lsr2 family protein [Nakamurella antarctica]|uniref:Lsr2 family protein n=1 Tax=Nakamurella antarctica TaxID=1902245 RepID=A0A3G8ZNT5_9ACTN|nr:Lsr2 family protein [Nakamurella antarctica]AZI58913.1 Lsr2 family protein [Nakamurella antarctica]